MTNETYTGQTDWRVGGVSKACPRRIVAKSFRCRSKVVARPEIDVE